MFIQPLTTIIFEQLKLENSAISVEMLETARFLYIYVFFYCLHSIVKILNQNILSASFMSYTISSVWIACTTHAPSYGTHGFRAYLLIDLTELSTEFLDRLMRQSRCILHFACTIFVPHFSRLFFFFFFNIF